MAAVTWSVPIPRNMHSSVSAQCHLCASNRARRRRAGRTRVDLNRFGEFLLTRLLANIKDVAVPVVAPVINQMHNTLPVHRCLRLDAPVRRANKCDSHGFSRSRTKAERAQRKDLHCI